MNIFVTVGTKSYPFERLVKAMDKKGIFIQCGTSTHPKKASFAEFLSKQGTYDKMRWADVVVCHAGVGTVMEAIDLGKKIVIVPRLSTEKEHIDDHQLVFANYIHKRFGIKPVLNIKELPKAIKSARAAKGISTNTSLINELKEKILC